MIRPSVRSFGRRSIEEGAGVADLPLPDPRMNPSCFTRLARLVPRPFEGPPPMTCPLWGTLRSVTGLVGMELLRFTARPRFRSMSVHGVVPRLVMLFEGLSGSVRTASPLSCIGHGAVCHLAVGRCVFVELPLEIPLDSCARFHFRRPLYVCHGLSIRTPPWRPSFSRRLSSYSPVPLSCLAGLIRIPVEGFEAIRTSISHESRRSRYFPRG